VTRNLVSADQVVPLKIITIVAALSCEVKPIVDALRLVKQCDKPFTVFNGKFGSETIEVLVSGIGASAMATAVGWMGGQRPLSERVWLNVGTAGHGSANLGSSFRVHASRDIFSERKHYPAMVAKSVFATDEILSVSAPTNEYPDRGAIDMEAYAFFSAAYKFCSAELAESIKVVSDNPNNDVSNLNAAKISALMEAHVDPMLDFGNALLALLPLNVQSANLDLPELHLTHSQRQQVITLIAKLTALNAIDSDLALAATGVRDSHELLSLLNSTLVAIEPQIDKAL